MKEYLATLYTVLRVQKKYHTHYTYNKKTWTAPRPNWKMLYLDLLNYCEMDSSLRVKVPAYTVMSLTARLARVCGRLSGKQNITERS